MPELHNILQENATPSADSAFTSPSLPTVGSTFARPGSLRAKTCRSLTCMRLVVATLASVAAVAVLISFCSRFFERRAVQGIPSRTLASPKDTDGSTGICGESGEGEEQQQRTRPQHPSSPARGILALPIKKRFLAQAVESGTGGDGRTPYQQAEQQDVFLDDRVGTPFGFVPPGAVPRPGQLHLQQLPFGTPQPSGEERTPAELDAASGILNLQSTHYTPASEDAADPKAEEKKSFDSQVRQLQRQIEQMQRRLNQLQQKLHKRRHSRRHQRAHLHQQHQLGLYQQGRPMLSQVPLREDEGDHQPLLQANALHRGQQQQQQHQKQQVMQRQGTQKAKQQEQKVVQDIGRTRIRKRKQQDSQQARQQEQQVLAEKKRKQEHEQTQQVQKKGELEKQKLLEDQQRLEPAELVSEEDVWISHGSQTTEKPLPSTSQQVLQLYASATSSGPSTFEAFRGQVTPEIHHASPSIAGADESRYGSAQASADAASAASGVSVRDMPIPGPSSAALTTSKGGTSLQVPTLSSLLTRDEAADAESAAAAGASMLASVSTPAGGGQLVAPNSYLDPMREHPFVYLPSPILERTPGPFVLNIKAAISRPPGRRNPVPLLEQVRRLFANRVLDLQQMKELRDIGQLLVGHAYYHQQDDLSNHQTYRMVHRLGIRFLVLDAVVSICIVLRQTPAADDWKAFVGAISHSPPPPTPRGMALCRSSFFTCLVNELSMAIQTLKTGRRPSPSDLVRIKRMLFCSEYSPPRLKEEDFDGWRKDDGCKIRWH
ncbi:hypothetical protein, conserved [Eimeria maxima]|uniref:Uncharacterized protein n=1 Tax=Eimeria maxima TaxID=5804 RepID=U6M9V3_EIMMA|nr:hypothetical protein, conserved [Eimeria maxima]CDJ60992.1 hypothetical protein, conserved [Eimeria maxima]